MTLSIEAIYENGVLKPVTPLPLKEHEKVRITVESGDSPLLRAHGIMGWTGDAQTLERIALDPIEPERSVAEQTAGMMPWNGDPELLRRIAEDDEFGIMESP